MEIKKEILETHFRDKNKNSMEIFSIRLNCNGFILQFTCIEFVITFQPEMPSG